MTAAAEATAPVVGVGGVEDTETKFLQRRGMSAGMSVAVYLRARGPSATARSPVPALVFHGSEVSTMMHVGENLGMCGGGLEARTRVRECALD